MKKFLVVAICLVLFGVIGCSPKNEQGVNKNEFEFVTSIVGNLAESNTKLITACADFIEGNIDKHSLLDICAKTQVELSEIENNYKQHSNSIKDQKLKEPLFLVEDCIDNMKKIINYTKELANNRYGGYDDKIIYEAGVFEKNLLRVHEILKDNFSEEPK